MRDWWRSARARTRILVAAGLVVVVVAAAAVTLVVVRHGDDDQQSALQQAMTRALPGAEMYSWTDWAAIRARLGRGIDQDSDVAALRAFLGRGFNADLTSRSALVDSAPVLQQQFGALSPASVEWELFSQSTSAAVLMLGLDPGVTSTDLARFLTVGGYTQSTDGTWRADDNTIRGDGGVTPELTTLWIDPDRHVLLASDSTGGLREGRTAYDAAAGVPALSGVVGALGEPVSAAVYDDVGVCQELAMSHADVPEQRAGADLLAQAGAINPLTGFAMADEPDGLVVATFGFENADQARTNATTRAKLASGAAPGQGGEFSDRFTLGTVTAVGDVVTMQMKPVAGAFVLTDLSTGPLLFATC